MVAKQASVLLTESFALEGPKERVRLRTGLVPAAVGLSERHRRLVIVAEEGADLRRLVDVLSDPRVGGVVSSDNLGPAEVGELCRCLGAPPSLRRPLHPLLRRGVAMHAIEVDDYLSKTAAVGEVAQRAQAHGVRRRCLSALEQALEEMLLNALYDAPVDAAGQPRYLSSPPSERLGIKAAPGERALVRCGGDARRFVVVVRDRFGSLRRQTVLSYLQRCAQAQAERSTPIECKPGGAGVGLYLIATCATELLFRLRKGRLTEVVYAISLHESAPTLRALLVDDDAGVPFLAGGCPG